MLLSGLIKALIGNKSVLAWKQLHSRRSRMLLLKPDFHSVWCVECTTHDGLHWKCNCGQFWVKDSQKMRAILEQTPAMMSFSLVMASVSQQQQNWKPWRKKGNKDSSIEKTHHPHYYYHTIFSLSITSQLKPFRRPVVHTDSFLG